MQKGNMEVLASENCVIILTERSVEIKSAREDDIKKDIK
jgi:hypothetical protein